MLASGHTSGIVHRSISNVACCARCLRRHAYPSILKAQQRLVTPSNGQRKAPIATARFHRHVPNRRRGRLAKARQDLLEVRTVPCHALTLILAAISVRIPACILTKVVANGDWGAALPGPGSTLSLPVSLTYALTLAAPRALRPVH
jgi:hypothetical protein